MKSTTLTLIRGTWDPMNKLEAWAKASLEGDHALEAQLHDEIMARGAKKPKLTLIDTTPAIKPFDRLVDLMTNACYDEALDMMMSMTEQEWIESDRYPYVA